MASSQGKVLLEVADFCCYCLSKMVQNPLKNVHVRCVTDFSESSTKRIPKVPDKAKALAKELVAEAKVVNDYIAEKTRLEKKKDGIFHLNEKKRGKLQKQIDLIQVHLEPAIETYKAKAIKFGDMVTNVFGDFKKMAAERKVEAGDKNMNDEKTSDTKGKAKARAKSTPNKSEMKKPAPKPAEPLLSAGQEAILQGRTVIKAVDYTRNELEKLHYAVRLAYKDNKFTAEEKDTLENLLRKLDCKVDDMDSYQDGSMEELKKTHQVNLDLPFGYDSGDEDLSDF